MKYQTLEAVQKIAASDDQSFRDAWIQLRFRLGQPARA
jgi:hypothetical protein